MDWRLSVGGRPLEAGFGESRRITQEYAKTFFFASLVLPRRERYASYSIYAICRIADEAVDGKVESLASERLAELRARIGSVYEDCELESGILLALRRTVNEHGIPRHYFDQLLEGVSTDLIKHRYRDFNELYSYCYRVAGVIGLMMLRILRCHDTRAGEHAVDLGVAMQLTNILRDISEDHQRGRIYLPADEMERFRVSENHIACAEVDDHFRALMQFSIQRARAYYARSNPGIGMIDNARSRFAIQVMKEIYSSILDSIEESAYDIFSRRAHVNLGRKIRIVSRILLRSVF